MKKLFYIICILMIVVSSEAAFDINDTDCNDGDSTTWCIQTTEQTITDADCGGTCSSGDTLYLEGGLRGELEFENIDGSPGYITVKNYPSDEQVIIKSGDDGDEDGSGGGVGVGHLTIENCQYLDIRGDNLSGHAWTEDCKTDSCYGIEVQQDGSESYESATVWVVGQSTHIKLRYLEIAMEDHGAAATGIGIMVKDDREARTHTFDTFLIEKNYVHDIPYSGFYLGSNFPWGDDDPWIANFTVQYNLLEDCAAYHMGMKGLAPSVNYINNNIFRRAGYTTTTAVYSSRKCVGFGAYSQDGSYVVAHSNWIEDCVGAGIAYFEGDHLIYNNIIVGSGLGVSNLPSSLPTGPAVDQGSHTGGDSSTVMTSSAAEGWSANKWSNAPNYVTNVTDDSSCKVTSSGSNTITCSGGLTGGSDNTWESGDTFFVGWNYKLNANGISTNNKNSSYAGNPKIYNNTIVNPGRYGISGWPDFDDPVAELKDNLIAGWSKGEWEGTDITEGSSPSANTATADPADAGFTTWSDDDDYSNDNFYITASSPAKDASGAGYPDEDYDGTARPIDGYADDGAYENLGTPIDSPPIDHGKTVIYRKVIR